MKYLKIKKTLAGLLVIYLLTPLYGAQNIARNLNQQLNNNNDVGRFDVVNNCVVYSGASSPAWAQKGAFEKIGLKYGFGNGGIDPYKRYSWDDYKKSSLFKFFTLSGFNRWEWKEERNGEGKCSGMSILKEASEKLGPDVFERIKQHHQEVAEANRIWENFSNNIVPRLVKAFSDKKVAGIISVGVIVLIGFPIVFWHFSKALSAYLFVRRPTIIGPKDSNIYAGFFGRLFFKFPDLPQVICNTYLQSRLDEVVSRNKKITEHNNKAKRNGLAKQAYHHMMLYGPPGLGKTLFAKNLAQKSGMNFIVFVVSDILQLPEHEALQEFKSIFKYARIYGPCVVVIDEADRLFDRSDLKAQKLATLFQKEFSDAIDTDIQVVCLTNYPWVFPAPIQSRLNTRIRFYKPDFETQKKLFALHLGIALKGRNLSASDLENTLNWCLGALDRQMLGDLNGRSIQAICSLFALQDSLTPDSLISCIKQHSRDEEAMDIYKQEQTSSPIDNEEITPSKNFWN